jgi:hypothetical protein
MNSLKCPYSYKKARVTVTYLKSYVTGSNDAILIEVGRTTRDSLTRRSLREILQQGAGSSGAQLSGPAATSEPVVEISAKGRDKPMVRNLPEVKTKTPLLGVSTADIPLQGANTSSKPTVGEGLGRLE